MKEITHALTDSQKRGRILLVSGLGVTAILILHGFIQELSKGKASLSDGIIGTVLLLLILILAFRDGQISLMLAAGCALLFAILSGGLILTMGIFILIGKPLPQPPTVGGTIELTITLAATAFATWVLFVSRDVKDFICHQRELPIQKEPAGK